MKSILFFTALAMTFWTCISKDGGKGKSLYASKMIEGFTGKKFFDYDEIEYWSNDFDGASVIDLYDNYFKSELDSFRAGVIVGNIPKSISDLTFINKLGEIGYSKSYIDKSYFSSIDSIFIEKETKENVGTACVYVFRDILIFKKGRRVIGVAKVCFGCMGNKIIGTTAMTDNFGQDGDYKRLEGILRH
nr:hypothetical protein [uncultured Flavobacterium sp.]